MKTRIVFCWKYELKKVCVPLTCLLGGGGEMKGKEGGRQQSPNFHDSREKLLRHQSAESVSSLLANLEKGIGLLAALSLCPGENLCNMALSPAPPRPPLQRCYPSSNFDWLSRPVNQKVRLPYSRLEGVINLPKKKVQFSCWLKSGFPCCIHKTGVLRVHPLTLSLFPPGCW